MSGAQQRLRSVTIGLALAFGSFLVGGALIVLVGQLLGAVGISVLDRPALQLGVSTGLLQGVTFGGTALLYLWVSGRNLAFLRVRVPTRRDIGWIIGGFVVLWVALLVVNTVIMALGLETAQNRIVEIGHQRPAVFLVLIPLSFVLVGPGEELLYRGLIQGILRESFHPALAVGLASLIFAVVHVFSLQGGGKLIYIGVVFTLALVLGLAYERTENLVVPVLIHGAYNAVQFALAYVTVTNRLAF